jgi:hypothetical protein
MAKGALLLTLILASSAAAAQRAQGEIDCVHTGTDFVYDCLIRIKIGDAPVPNLSISVGADMPSMPMAHNVRPVKARPGAAPGEYRARLDLDMPGEWAIKLRLSGAVRDVLVVRHTFTESGTAPRK